LKKIKTKQGWWNGSCARVPVLQAYGHDFKLKYRQKKYIKWLYLCGLLSGSSIPLIYVSVLSQYHADFISLALKNNSCITFNTSQQQTNIPIASHPHQQLIWSVLIHFGNFNSCIMISLYFDFHFINDTVLSIF
jgi:hypothetical protein